MSAQLVDLFALDLDSHPSHPDAHCVTEGAQLWTSDDKRDRQLAAQHCQGCPIIDACLAGALARGEKWGTWGGRDLETEYREKPPQRRRHAPAQCGTASGYKRHRRVPEPACGPCLAARRQQLLEPRS